MALELLHHEGMLGSKQGLCIERVAVVLGFECACPSWHADQCDSAAQHQNQAEKSHGNPPRELSRSPNQDTSLGGECQPVEGDKVATHRRKLPQLSAQTAQVSGPLCLTPRPLSSWFRQPRRDSMRKLILGSRPSAAIVAAGSLAWASSATIPFAQLPAC